MKLAFIVPYRDRLNHLNRFLPHHRKLFPDAEFIVVEQEPGKPFNRGKLLNVGFLEAQHCDYFAFQDVDMLCLRADYSYRKGVTQLAASRIQKVDYLGGVTLFDRETFELAGGYHNDYFHRAEDNCMRFNLKRLNIPVLELPGVFKILPHPRKSPEFIPALWEKAQQKRIIQNQLSVCKYTVINRVRINVNAEIISVNL